MLFTTTRRRCFATFSYAIVLALQHLPLLAVGFCFIQYGGQTRRRHEAINFIGSLSSSSSADNQEISDGVIEDNTWRSGIRFPSGSDKESALNSIQELCKSTPYRRPSSGESGLAFLFVSQPYAEFFPEVVRKAYETLGDDTVLLSVVGGGVIGGGEESDNPSKPAISLLCGLVPSATAGVEVFMFGPDEAPPPPSTKLEAWKAIGRGQNTPSYIMFADPWAPIQEVLEGLDASGVDGAIVAGGISCPLFGENGPTVGMNGKTYPRGTAVGVGLSGTVGLQAVVAQGCRPIGPAFAVTKAEKNIILELDSKPAMEAIKDLTEGDFLSEEDKLLIKTNGFLCGLAAPGTSSVEKGDYLVREIIGFRSPGIIIGVEAKTGDVLRFHVRDGDAARYDFKNMVGRAKTERMFAGPQKAGTPLAAVQVSCVARGRSLFGASNVDITNVASLLGGAADDDDHDTAAIAGFFANGELGPVGISGIGLDSKQTQIHGFTTVAATICDFSSSKSDAATSIFSATSSQNEVDEDAGAWG